MAGMWVKDRMTCVWRPPTAPEPSPEELALHQSPLFSFASCTSHPREEDSLAEAEGGGNQPVGVDEDSSTDVPTRYSRLACHHHWPATTSWPPEILPISLGFLHTVETFPTPPLTEGPLVPQMTLVQTPAFHRCGNQGQGSSGLATGMGCS